MTAASIPTAKLGRGSSAGLASALAMAVLFTMGACLSDDAQSGTDDDLSAALDTDHPCDLLSIEDASRILFGDSPTEGPSEHVELSLLGCDDRLSLMERDQEVGSIDLVTRVFAKDRSGQDDGTVSYDQIDGFLPTGQQEVNEILDSSVDPISSDWDDGEVYTLDGLFRNRDLYVVGAWGETAVYAVGVSFRVTSEQEYFDQPLTYHEYCDRTDLAADCLVSASVVREWMTDEYLPAILERLSAASPD